MTRISSTSSAQSARNVATMLELDAFTRWLGAELVEASPGRCTLQLRVREDMLNGFGVSHGGIVFSLADSPIAFACNGGPDVTVALQNAISHSAVVRARDELNAVPQDEPCT